MQADAFALIATYAVGVGLKKTHSGAPNNPHPSPRSLITSSAKPAKREGPKVGRNDACPCKSGKKFKRCCIEGERATLNAGKEESK